MKYHRHIAAAITAITDLSHAVLSRFVSEKYLAAWKPIHLCWWFEKHGHLTPRYFIGTHVSSPTVSTGAASSITTTSFTMGGTIDDTGGSNPTVRGFVYVVGAGGTPTISDTVVNQSGSFGTGAYSLGISGLAPGTIYSVRAYATNSAGTGYGSTVEVTTTAASAPTVTTQAVTSIAITTATGNGNVTADGGATITERGVCWSTSPTPTTANSKATSAGTTGAFTASMTGLTGNTLYYVRAYAINSVGTSYGSEVTFTTLPSNVAPGAPTLSSPAAPTVATYYFDASDNGPTDPDGVWSSEANAFDGDTGTDTSGDATLALGSNTVRELSAGGTNAPASGGGITQVRVRFYGSSGYSFSTFDVDESVYEIWTDGGVATGEQLAVVPFLLTTPSWTGYTTLLSPTGGWTWEKLQALETVVWCNHDAGLSAPTVGRIEIEVTSIPVLTDTTPTLEFAATDADGDDVRYQVQVDNEDTFATPTLDKISGTDAGFANVTTPADTDPFNSGDTASFTVQAGDALADGTYYWRVRAIDPSGTNTYGSWSTTRSFTVETATGPADLVAAQGSFTLTGYAANLRRAFQLVAAQATFTLTGQATAFSKNLRLAAEQATFTLSMQTADFARTYRVTMDSGGFTLSGQATLFLYQRTLPAAQASFTLTGQAATFQKSLNITAAQGTFTLTGQAALFPVERTLPLASGTFTLTGNQADFNRAEILVVSAASFTLSGQAATLPLARSLALTGATFTLSGQAATLSRALTVPLEAGSFTLSGQAATLLKSISLPAVSGTFTLTGQDVAFTRALSLQAEQGTFTLTGQATTYTRALSLAADQASFTLSGQAASFPLAQTFLASGATFTLSGQAAAFQLARVLPVSSATFTLTGNQADFNRAEILVVSSGTFTLSGQAVAFSNDLTFAASQGTFTLTGQTTALQLSSILPVSSGTFTLTGNQADFDRAEILVVSLATFTLSGQAVAFSRDLSLSAGTGTFTLSGIAATLTYTPIVNTPPGAPTLTTPADIATIFDTTPSFVFSATDPNGDSLCYEIEISDVPFT